MHVTETENTVATTKRVVTQTYGQEALKQLFLADRGTGDQRGERLTSMTLTVNIGYRIEEIDLASDECDVIATFTYEPTTVK